MIVVECPVCDSIITFKVIPKLHQPVTCSACLTDLQVISVNPFDVDIYEFSARQPARRSKSETSKRNKRKEDDLIRDDEIKSEYRIKKKRSKPSPERDKERKSVLGEIP